MRVKGIFNSLILIFEFNRDSRQNFFKKNRKIEVDMNILSLQEGEKNDQNTVKATM